MSAADLALLFVAGLGVGVLGVHFALLWRRREVLDPLGSVPPRAIWVAPIHLLAVLLVYMAVLWCAALAIEPSGGRPSSRPAGTRSPATRAAASRASSSSPAADTRPGRSTAQTESRLRLVLADVVAKAIAVAFIIYLAFRFAPGGLAGFGLSGRGVWGHLGRGTCGYLAAVPLVYGLLLAIVAVLQAVSDFRPPPHQIVEALTGPGLEARWKVVLVISAVVAAPVGEEFFFRGLVQNVLLTAGLGRYPAVLLTATVFGLVHWDVPHTIVPLIVLGIVLGYLYERTGSLIAPLATHVCFNAATIASVLWMGAAPT